MHEHNDLELALSAGGLLVDGIAAIRVAGVEHACSRTGRLLASSIVHAWLRPASSCTLTSVALLLGRGLQRFHVQSTTIRYAR